MGNLLAKKTSIVTLVAALTVAGFLFFSLKNVSASDHDDHGNDHGRPTATPNPTPTPTPTPKHEDCDNHGDHNNDRDDHDCDKSTPTPKPSCHASATPTPTPTPTESASPSPEPTVTPTPTDPPDNSNNASSGGSVGAPVCGATVPGTPTILTVIQNGSKATITWTAVANATYYSIVYGTGSTYQYGVANTGNVTSYTINSLTPGVSYHYAVNAVNDCMPGAQATLSGTGTGGQVLGASTMAGTGTFDVTLYEVIMGVGGILTFIGIKNLKKAEQA